MDFTIVVDLTLRAILVENEIKLVIFVRLSPRVVSTVKSQQLNAQRRLLYYIIDFIHLKLFKRVVALQFKV